MLWESLNLCRDTTCAILPKVCGAKRKMPLAGWSRAGSLISKIQLKRQITRAQEGVVQLRFNRSMIWQFANTRIRCYFVTVHIC